MICRAQAYMYAFDHLSSRSILWTFIMFFASLALAAGQPAPRSRWLRTSPPWRGRMGIILKVCSLQRKDVTDWNKPNHRGTAQDLRDPAHSFVEWLDIYVQLSIVSDEPPQSERDTHTESSLHTHTPKRAASVLHTWCNK